MPWIPFLDAFRKECLLNGWDDIGLTLRHADKIMAFEEKAPDRPALAVRINKETDMKICVLPVASVPKSSRRAVRILKALDLGFEMEEALLGGGAVDATGNPYPEATQKWRA